LISRTWFENQEQLKWTDQEISNQLQSHSEECSDQKVWAKSAINESNEKEYWEYIQISW